MNHVVQFKNVVAFSGGRTSAYMLRLLLDKHGDELRNNWLVMFCNTGKEMNETLDFVHEVETRWSVPVVWLEYTRIPAIDVDPMMYPSKKAQQTILKQQEAGETTHWFRITNYENAKRNGESNLPFDELLGWVGALPNVQTRSCSGFLKVRTTMRCLFWMGIHRWNTYVGFRDDEPTRALDLLASTPKYIRPHFPLMEAGFTEKDVMDFWQQQDFDLQVKQHQGNCDLCFLKAKWKRRTIAKANPQAIEWWEKWEKEFKRKLAVKGDGSSFIKGSSYAALRIDLERQGEFAFDKEDVDIPCACFDRGFEFGNEDDVSM